MRPDRATDTVEALPLASIADLLPGHAQSGLCRALADAPPPDQRGADWMTARGTVRLDGPVIVGILNVTPDSFSDGGTYMDPAAALDHAAVMIAEGADMLDVGGQSTRPGGARSVPVDEEWRRLAPVLRELARQHPECPVSVDTVKSEIAERALDAGVWAINDVSGLRFDARVADVCARHNAGLILMHSRGRFSEISSYDHTCYTDVVANVAHELALAVGLAQERGVGREALVLDPGFGFAKLPEQNYSLLGGLPTLKRGGFPVMVGPSRKRFLRVLVQHATLGADRVTAAVCLIALLLGANLFRVHAVRVVGEVLAFGRVES